MNTSYNSSEEINQTRITCIGRRSVIWFPRTFPLLKDVQLDCDVEGLMLLRQCPSVERLHAGFRVRLENRETDCIVPHIRQLRVPELSRCVVGPKLRHLTLLRKLSPYGIDYTLSTWVDMFARLKSLRIHVYDGLTTYERFLGSLSSTMPELRALGIRFWIDEPCIAYVASISEVKKLMYAHTTH